MRRTVVVCLVILFATMPLGAQRKVNRELPRERASEVLSIEFHDPLGMAEVANFVARTGVEPTAFEYAENEMVGGYVVAEDESLTDALENFRARHQQFLANMVRSLRSGIDEVPEFRAESDAEQLLESFEALATTGTSVRVSAIEGRSDDWNGVLREPQVRALSIARRDRADTAENNESAKADIETNSEDHESWAPYKGYSDVTRDYTNQTFFFDDVSAFDSRSTYESETQVYDKKFANFNGYWASNMPSAYYDTPFGDSIDNFTVGTSRASSLKANKSYYTYMDLKRQTAKTAKVRIKGQKGHRTPSRCDSTWCIYADATTGSLANYTAPGFKKWTY